MRMLAHDSHNRDAAIESARCYLDKFKEVFCPIGRISLVDDFHQVLVGTALNETVTMARLGEYVSHKTLCATAANLGERGMPVPVPLQAYIGELRPRKRRGQRYFALWLRNIFVCEAVKRVVERGFNPTRNEASRGDPDRESASSIVSAAFEAIGKPMKERQVETIWLRRPEKILAAKMTEVRAQ